MTIQRALTEADELRLGLITLHEDSQGSTSHHKGGQSAEKRTGRSPAQQAKDRQDAKRSAELAGWTGKHDTPSSPHREHMQGGGGQGGGGQEPSGLSDMSDEDLEADISHMRGLMAEFERGSETWTNARGEIGALLEEHDRREQSRGAEADDADAVAEGMSGSIGPGMSAERTRQEQRPSGQPLPGAAPPAGDLEEPSQGGGRGFRAYRGERGRERGSTSQDDPSQQTGREAYTSERSSERPSLRRSVTKATVASTDAVIALHDTPGSPHRKHMGGGREADMVSSPEKRLAYLRDKPVGEWTEEDANMAVEMARQGSEEANGLYEDYLTGGEPEGPRGTPVSPEASSQAANYFEDDPNRGQGPPYPYAGGGRFR